MIASIFAIGTIMTVASPAQADSTLCTGNSYSTCTNAGYTDHGYGANSGTSYWTMYAGHNCTNYAAYMASQNGAPAPNYNLGSALTWASQAASHGVPVNSTPAVGAIAQWDAYAGYAGSSGHVAYVEAVTSNSITVSEDNFASGPFSWKTIAAGSPDWPSNFIHFADVSPGSTAAKTTTSSSDVDANGAADLLLTTNQPTGGSAVSVLESTWEGFLGSQQWWNDPTVGWAGIRPLVGDVNGDKKADYTFIANSGAGVRAYVALSTGAGFSIPQLWWNGDSYGYQSAKILMGDVDGNRASDIIFVYANGTSSVVATVALSTWQGFLAPQVWWSSSNYTFSSITPLVGDVKITIDPATGQPDRAADLVLFTNEGSGGTKARVATSSRSSFVGATLWWSATSYAYADVKPVLGDVDGNRAADLVLVRKLSNGGTEVKVALSTWDGFIAMTTWWTATSYGWSGLTPLIGDVKITVDPATGQPDNAADLVLLTDEGSNGTKVWVATSSRSSFVGSALWWHGSGWGHAGIKPSLG